MGMGDLRGSGSVRVIELVGMDWTLVLEQKALQGVRREDCFGSDNFQCCFRLLLQSPSACAPRDHSTSFQGVCLTTATTTTFLVHVISIAFNMLASVLLLLLLCKFVVCRVSIILSYCLFWY